MRVEINGTLQHVEDGETVLGLLVGLGVPLEGVVVELNGEIPERQHWEEVVMKPGDRLEVVRFMGGG